jgi:hypothetical protein
MMSSVYENASLYIPLVQPLHIPSSISIDSSSYWHISALHSLLYDSITLPTRTRIEHPFAMDMYDFTARVNIHGQRKIASPEVAVLFDNPGVHDLMPLGWPEARGEKPIVATVLRGLVDEVDAVTTTLSQGSVVTER